MTSALSLLDVVVGYDCNLKCTYCTISDAMRRRALTRRLILEELRHAAARGCRRVAFTGGEPTIFPDLPALIRQAKELGFREIKVASNGLRYAHMGYLDHLIAAGANQFHMSMHGVGDLEYERTVQLHGSAKLRRQAIANLVARGYPPIADLIIKSDTLAHLEEWISLLRAEGIDDFKLWLVSLTDENAKNPEQLPALSAVAPQLMRVFDGARRDGYRATSLHVPRCLLPGYEDHVEHPGAEGVRVVTPDDRFDLKASRLTGGVKPEKSCAACRYRDRCPGLREDYVARFGSNELRCVPT